MAAIVSFILRGVRNVRAVVGIGPISFGCLMLLGPSQQTFAQNASWKIAPYATAPAVVRVGNARMPVAGFAEPPQPERRGPLARLVRNPHSSSGLPPFALTDQAGNIQRYVEPVDSVDLEPYVNQVVIVRHDTGRTLLASQLELPSQPLLPLLGETAAPQTAIGGPVQQVQFADNDDATVELLPDGEPTSLESVGEARKTDASANVESSVDEMPQGHGTPMDPKAEPTEMLPGPPRMDGSFDPADPNSPFTDDWDYIEPCPECGGNHVTSECPPAFAHQSHWTWAGPNPPPARFFAEVEFNFFRTHLVANENVVGKLSEQYEFSPRFSLGFRDTGKLDGRARYWRYDRDTRALAGGSVNVEFNVLDLEGIHVFLGRRSELQLASGLRLASINLAESGTTAGADLVGITLAADGRTYLCDLDEGLFTWTYGGRLAVLGGDWHGENGNAFVNSLTQDDNVIVHELYAGIDYAICYREFDFHSRLGFEMQNWHSDALASNSIGIIGPSILIGAEF
jgi:hypothetical protein